MDDVVIGFKRGIGFFLAQLVMSFIFISLFITILALAHAEIFEFIFSLGQA